MQTLRRPGGLTAVRRHRETNSIRRAALSGMARNRATAFAPIVVALLGIGILAVSGGGRDQETLMSSSASIDTIITGSVAGEPELPPRQAR